MRKIMMFLMFAWCAALSVIAWAYLWPTDTGFMSKVLQWASPSLLILTYLLSTGIAVRHNLRSSNHFPGFSGLLPENTAIEVIGKWGVRW